MRFDFLILRVACVSLFQSSSSFGAIAHVPDNRISVVSRKQFIMVNQRARADRYGTTEGIFPFRCLSEKKSKSRLIDLLYRLNDIISR